MGSTSDLSTTKIQNNICIDFLPISKKNHVIFLLFSKEFVMFKTVLAGFILAVSLSACTTLKNQNKYDKPLNLLFINKELNSIPLQVQRDERLCDDDKAHDQNCPIKFYIDDFKAGDFYINTLLSLTKIHE